MKSPIARHAAQILLPRYHFPPAIVDITALFYAVAGNAHPKIGMLEGWTGRSLSAPGLSGMLVCGMLVSRAPLPALILPPRLFEGSR